MKAEAKRILSGKDCRIGTGENGEHIPLYTFDAAIEAMEEYAQSQLPKEEKDELQLVKIERLWFPVGVQLTSLENGQLIIAGPDTPDNLIVGTVVPEGLKI